MPRFSDTEKGNIQQKLLTAGEKLFVAYGLKKVTIDELIEAVNIAKATFYTFYKSKEYLYLDIVQGIQTNIFDELERLLVRNADLLGKERVRQVFSRMTELMTQYPILAQIDTDTVDIISRKVSKERMILFYQQNIDAAQSLHNRGVCFTCEINVASMIFQALYRCFVNMQIGTFEKQTLAINLMRDGIIDKIVID